MSDLIPIPCDVIERMRLAMGFSLDRWADLLKIKIFQYKAALASDSFAFTTREIESLAEILALEPQSIISGKIDFKALESQNLGETTAIPDEFKVGARSRIRTSAHLIDGLEHKQGWLARRRLLRKLQVPESRLMSPDAAINIRFLSRVCESMASAGFSDVDVWSIGALSTARNFNTPLGHLYRSFKTPNEVYERSFGELVQTYFDQNYLYRILRLDSSRCLVEARCNPEVMDALKEKHLGNAYVCAAKAGAFAALPGYLCLPFAITSETQCIHRGDSACVFEIDYSAARMSLVERLQRNDPNPAQVSQNNPTMNLPS